MTDLERLGQQLRSELGDPPASWAHRQRLRLRGADLEPRPSHKPRLLVAALAAASLLALGVYYFPESEIRQAAKSNEEGPPSPSAATRGEEVWVEAGAERTTHRLSDGSEIALEPRARGRLDQREDLGTRFDLHEGNAAFDVKKQEGRSFSVVAGEYRVVVVGTRFSTAYVPPSELTVAVEEGAVEVHLPGREAPLSVGGGELLHIEGREFSLTEQRQDTDESAADGTTDDVDAVQRDDEKRPPSVSWQQLYREGKYSQACEDARARSIPELAGRLGATDLIDLASALRLCGDTQGAMTTLETVRRRFPGSVEAHNALFLIGRVQATRGQAAAAISSFDQYLAGAGQGRFAAEALGRLIELHQAAGNRQKARKYAERYLQLAPRGPYRKLAESVIGNPEL